MRYLSRKGRGNEKEYGLNCRIYADHETMLEKENKLDLVHVCTPPYVHAEISIHALDAGCNVVVEKPMATCLSECDQMLEAENEAKHLLASRRIVSAIRSIN